MSKSANMTRHIGRLERTASLGVPHWWEALRITNGYSEKEEAEGLFKAVRENMQNYDDPVRNWVDLVRTHVYSYFGARHNYDPACVDGLCNFGQWYVLRDGSIFCDVLESGALSFVIEATRLTEYYAGFKSACAYWMLLASEEDFVVKELMTDFVRAFTMAWGRAEETNHNDKAFLKTLELCGNEQRGLNPAEHWKVLFFLEVGQHNKTKASMEVLKARTEDPCHFLKYEDAVAYVSRHSQQEEVLRSMLEALLPKSEHDNLVKDIEEERIKRKRSAEKPAATTIINNNYEAGSTAQVLNGEVHDSKIG